MQLFARSYGRHATPNQRRSDSGQFAENQTADRVRVIAGALAGLEGRVISSSNPERWLVATQFAGLVLRIEPHLLEPLPATGAQV